MKNILKSALCCALLIAGAILSVSAGDCPLKTGDELAFLGDSITQYGNSNCGYLHLVISALKWKGIDVKMIPAGVSGNKCIQMRDRFDRDVLRKGATWMTLSCGVNDVWHGERGVPLEQYRDVITEILDKADQAGIKVMILTATMIGEDAKNANNVKLAKYNDFLREIAKKRNYLLADLNTDMQKIVGEARAKNPKCGYVLTSDGVHMNFFGNKMMASGILRAFGFTDEELQKVDAEVWRNRAGAFEVRVNFSQNEYEQLQKEAKDANMPVRDYLHKQVVK